MWRDHPLCASDVAWPARFWSPERLDPSAWREMSSRLDPRVEIDALIAALAPSSPRRVLDVGGGTGLLTRALASRFGGCLVIEPSAAQVAELPAGLVVARGRAEALPIATASIDAAVATWVLQYTDDPAASVRELARVIAPRGAVAIVQAAPGNDLVDVYNDEARVVGLAPAHHGYLLALAAEALEAAGFAVALARVPVALRVAPDDAALVADVLARLHFADHPAAARAAMIAATTPRIAAAVRARGALCDDGVLLTAAR